MTDEQQPDIFKQVAQRFDTETDYGLKNGLLLVASSLTLQVVRNWLAESYPGERIPEADIQLDLAKAHFWLLDKRLATPRELIESLASSGLIAEPRKFAGLEAVYVPPQGVATRRAALWN